MLKNLISSLLTHHCHCIQRSIFEGAKNTWNLFIHLKKGVKLAETVPLLYWLRWTPFHWVNHFCVIVRDAWISSFETLCVFVTVKGENFSKNIIAMLTNPIHHARSFGIRLNKCKIFKMKNKKHADINKMHLSEIVCVTVNCINRAWEFEKK